MTAEPFPEADVPRAKEMIVPPFFIARGEEPKEILRIWFRVSGVDAAEIVAAVEVIDADLDMDRLKGGHIGGTPLNLSANHHKAATPKAMSTENV